MILQKKSYHLLFIYLFKKLNFNIIYKTAKILSMYKILILCFIASVYCDWFSGGLGRDKCIKNSDCSNGYYCKFVDNTCYIEGQYLTKCGYCTGKGL